MKALVRHSWFPAGILCLIVLGFFDGFARVYSLYFIFPVFDNIIHFFGGITLGIFAVMISEVFFAHSPILVRVLIIIGIALLGGVLVEWGESWFIAMNNLRMQDTLMDLLYDILGAVVITTYYLFSCRNSNNTLQT